MLRTVSALSAALFLAAAPAAQAQDLYFDLYNNTSDTLMELYISPSNVDSWEEDVLGLNVLGAYEATQVIIADGRGDCIYDILGVFANGDQVDDYGVDLCNLGSYEFFD